VQFAVLDQLQDLDWEDEDVPNRSQWLRVAVEPVMQGSSDTMTARQCAFALMDLLHKNAMTMKALDVVIKYTARAFAGCAFGPPGPDNPKNRHPTSLAVCKVLINVPSLLRYRIAVCPRGCCTWSNLPSQPQKAFERHYRNCNDQHCQYCWCSQCRASFFVENNGKPQPEQFCYMFHDVFQQFFGDEEWVTAVMATRAQQRQADAATQAGQTCPPDAQFYATNKWKRLREALAKLGFDLDKV
jgi:hypothetical protein